MSKDVVPQKKPSMPTGDTREAVGPEKISSLSSMDWSNSVNTSGNPHMQAENFGSVRSTVNSGSVFSSSLPVVLHEKGKLSSSLRESMDCEGAHIERETGELTFGSLYDEGATSTIGDLLPDDEEELLAGITDGLDFMNLYSATEETEDFDLFSSGGGLEMDGDTQEAFGMYANNPRNLNGGFLSNSGSLNGPSNVPGSVIGEHPYGEHPSRTLFVRNINSNVEDSELRALFEHFGDIRTLYTACKHRGFVMISYYDIRSARSAMRALQNKPLRRRKLDIHFSIPKDNPSDKDVNQGTLVVFNLDVSVSNDDLCHIFGHYGEIKEIRETPHKRHHKFIEFYDVRAAEAALRALNRSDIAGKRIKLEPSRPGGARRSLMQQLSQDLEQDEVRSFRQQAGSPMTSSPPGQFSPWGMQFGSPAESSASWTSHHSLGNFPGTNKPFPGFSVTLPPPNSMRVGTIGSHLGRTSSGDTNLPSIPTTSVGMPMHRAHSLPDHANGVVPSLNTRAPIPIRGTSHDVVEGLRLARVGSDVSLFENAPGAVGIPDGASANRLNSGSGSTSLSGPQFLWGNSSPYQHNSSVLWSTPPIGQDFNPPGHTPQGRPFAYAGPHGGLPGGGFSSHRFHVGSAPSGDHSNLDRHLGYLVESPDTSFFGPSSMRPPLGAQGAAMLNMSTGHQFSGSLGTNGGFEIGSLPYRRSYMFPTSSMSMSGTSEGFADRARIRRTESSVSQAESKKQYQLDIDRILRGEDNRTTLMIKNIPNKYTSKMLLAAIDENHRGTYDFMYLPIDFKNKCNVGYAFINMTSPSHIIPLYQAFNGKKWEKFNSEKVASLAYARIQGKAALVAHFQNSSLMNEDKRCRPILFHSEGLETGEQEQIPLTIDIRDRVSRERNGFGEFMEANTQNNNRESAAPRFEGISSTSPAKE